MTLAIPDELRERMKNFPEIRWSALARAAFESRVNDMEEIEKIASKSKLTKKDAEEIANKINEAAARRIITKWKASKHR